ncbi:MAG: FtsX-like permease family protein, partial [Burkholderiales bacterium]
MLTGAVFGLLPALQSAQPHLTEALKEGNKGGGGARQPIRSGLVVAEVALALLLLVGAGLMLRSFAFLNRIDTGFNAKNLLTMSTMLSPTRYADAAKARGFYDELQRRIQPLPGVQAVAFSTSVPLGSSFVTSVVLEGQAFNRYSEGYLAVNSIVSADYFQAMGIRLRNGRLFAPQDTPNSGGLVGVIDENMARDLFAGKDPLGQAILLDEGRLRVQIVGVVNHIRHLSYDADEQSKVKYQFYTSLAQTPDEFVVRVMSNLNLIVRSDHDPTDLIAAVRAQVFALDREQLVYNARTMEQIIAGTIAQRRFLMFLLALFAVVAITLAVVGIYGVISYSVTQRTHEIGIRLALGAGRGRIVRQLLTESVLLALAGGTLGLLFAYWGTDLIHASIPPLPYPIDLDVNPDLRVLKWTLIISLLTGVIFGLAPALIASRPDLVPVLKGDAAGQPRDERFRRWNLRGLLVVAQVAVSIVVLVCAGLFLRSLKLAQQADPGFKVDNLATMMLDPGLLNYSEQDGKRFYRELLGRIESQPGVRAASLVLYLPLGDSNLNRGPVLREGDPPPQPGEGVEVDGNIVAPKY